MMFKICLLYTIPSTCFRKLFNFIQNFRLFKRDQANKWVSPVTKAPFKVIQKAPSDIALNVTLVHQDCLENIVDVVLVVVDPLVKDKLFKGQI